MSVHAALSESTDARLHHLVNAVVGQGLLEQRNNSTNNAPVRAIIEHAIKTVPFYSESGINPSKAVSLSSLPLITREQIVGNPTQFHSCSYDSNEHIVATTSGTTGVPLRVVRDRASFYMFAFDTYREVFRLIPGLKELPEAGQYAVSLVNDNPQREDQVMINPSINYALMHRSIFGKGSVSDHKVIENLVNERAPLLYGRPRSLVQVAETYVASSARNIGKIRPRAILCSGDNLYKESRSFLEEVFDAPVYNAYGSQEAGLVAIECSNHCGLHVIPDRAVVEVLTKSSDVPMPTGEGQLVITSLENWAMPFLRYCTGDIVKIEVTKCLCGFSGSTLTRMDGRDSIYFVVGTRRINPSVLNPVFEDLPIKQFQVIQSKDHGFIVNWIPRSPNADSVEIEGLMRSSLLAMLGPVDIRFSMTDSLEEPNKKIQRYVRQ